MVAQSDLLATLPERIARHFALLLGLQVLEPPLPLGEMNTAMFWHERMQNNPAHRWLRQQIKQVAQPIAGPD